MRWTYDICRSLALKYTVQRDFRAENKGAFDAAIRNGWMKDFSWLKDGRECAKPHPTKWSYDACYQEAKKYETRTDFMRGNESAYHKAQQKGWINDYKWFVDGNKRNAERNTKWTYRACLDLAKECNTITEFIKKSSSAYDSARRNGWLKKYTWFKNGVHLAAMRKIKWTYEVCHALAAQFKTTKDFYDTYPMAYNASVRRGWIKCFSWLEHQEKKRDIKEMKEVDAKQDDDKDFALNVKESKSLFFTNTEANRVEISNEISFDFKQWVATFIPKQRLLEYHKEEKPQVLSANFTNRLIALEHNSINSFKWKNPAAYAVAVENGWLKDYTWLRDGRDSGITRNLVFKVNQNFNHSHPKYTNEQIIEAAKKYTKKVDFLHNDNALYHAALHRGLMEQFTWLQSSAHLFDSINYVYRYYFKEENAVYVGRTIDPRKRDLEHHRERGDESSSVLKFAQEKCVEIPPMEILAKGLSGIDSQRVEDEYVQRYRAEGMVVLNIGATGVGRGSMGMKKKYSRQKFFQLARQYTELSEFKKYQNGAYEAGCKNGWIHECDWLSRKVRKSSLFTKDYCMAIAKTCTSRKELSEKDSTVYGKMVSNGWFEECDWLPSAHEGYHELTHDYCLEVAQQYSTVQSLAKDHSAIVRKLYKKGWIRECGWMAIRWKNRINKFDLNGNLLATYDSFKDAAKSVSDLTNSPNARILISEVCRHKSESAYGFIWRFAEGDAEKKEPGLTAD